MKSIPEQLEEVSRMTDDELSEIRDTATERPGIIRQFAEAILEGSIADTLKIVKEVSKMDRPDVADHEVSIDELAIGDDDEAFYKALIQQNVAQLMRKGISPQETARLTQNLDIFRTKLRDIRSRRPKVGTVLERVLTAAAAGPVSKTKSKTAKTAKSAKPGAKKRSTTAPKAARGASSKKGKAKPTGVRKNAKKA